MKYFIKLLCLLLCLVTLLTVFAACKNDKPTDTETQPPVETTDGNLDENGYEKDSINQTFGGKSVKMLVWNEKKDELIPEQNTNGADLITDAIYSRNLELEARLDIYLDPVYVNGNWKERNTFMEAAEKAGDNNIDIVVSFASWPSLMAQKGLLTNLNALTYPELDKTWWPDTLSEYEQGGSLFFVANNSSIRLLRSMIVCYANTKMIENYGLDDLATKVLDYEWTLDTMLTYSQYVEPDLNLPAENRTYAVCVDDQSRMDGFFFASGLTITSRDDTGKTTVVLNKKASKDKAESLVNKLGPVFNSDLGYISSISDDVTPMEENRTMFMVSFLQSVSVLRDNKNYTVLPMPMYDEAQKEYYTLHTADYDVWGIFAGAEDKEMCGVILEAFASSDYRTMAPTYYDDSVKYRYSNSGEGVKIFELIRDSVVYDFGRICEASLSIPLQPFRDCFWDKPSMTQKFKNNYVSSVAGSSTVWSITMSEIIKAYEKYADR